jgi:hypothetical protein
LVVYTERSRLNMFENNNTEINYEFIIIDINVFEQHTHMPGVGRDTVCGVV